MNKEKNLHKSDNLTLTKHFVSCTFVLVVLTLIALCCGILLLLHSALLKWTLLL